MRITVILSFVIYAILPMALFAQDQRTILPNLPSSVDKAYQTYQDALVKITVIGNPKPTREGTGFIVYSSDSLSVIVTAAHVIGSISTEPNSNPDWIVSNGKVDRTVVITNTKTAFNFNSSSEPFAVYPIANSDAVVLTLKRRIVPDGKSVFSMYSSIAELNHASDIVVLGYPKGYSVAYYPPSLLHGGLNGEGLYQVDGILRDGESGGPFLDRYEKVVAIAGNVVHSSGLAFSTGTPVSSITSVIQSLIPTRPHPIDASEQTCSGEPSASEPEDAKPLTIAAECLIKTGATFRECAQCPAMTVLPAGSFLMGAPIAEARPSTDEGPVRTVKIDTPFAVSRTPITRRELADFAEDTHHVFNNSCKIMYSDYHFRNTAGYSWKNPGFAQDDDHPAVCLDWLDAQAFVEWLKNKTGKKYRLLSEAEYEYAASGRTTNNSRSLYPPYINVSQLCSFVNYADCHKNGTSSVGQFKPNEFGLHDMLGNAFQWVEDCFHPSFDGAPVNGDAWVEPSCRRRVAKGGSWDSLARAVRPAFRREEPPNAAYSDFGIRVARSLSREKH